DRATLFGFKSRGRRAELEAALEPVRAPFIEWLDAAVRTTRFKDLVAWKAIWQLSIHTGPRRLIELWIDFRSTDGLALSPGRHPDANYFTHLSGRTMLEVLEGRVPPSAFWLTGAGRSYHKLLGVRDGHFFAPEMLDKAEDELGDPL